MVRRWMLRTLNVFINFFSIEFINLKFEDNVWIYLEDNLVEGCKILRQTFERIPTNKIFLQFDIFRCSGRCFGRVQAD